MFDQNFSHTFEEQKTLLKCKCQGRSRNQKTMTLRTKNIPATSKKLWDSLVIGLMSMPMQTPKPRAVKQYVNPHLTGVDMTSKQGQKPKAHLNVI